MNLRKSLPLYIKLEGLLGILYKNCIMDCKDKFSFPNKSIFDLNAVGKSPRLPSRYMLLQNQSSYNSENIINSNDSLKSMPEVAEKKKMSKKHSMEKNANNKSHYSAIKKILNEMI